MLTTYVNYLCHYLKSQCVNPESDAMDDANGCTPYTPPSYTYTLKWILWGNWTVSFLVTLIGIIYMYRLWVQHKELVDDWPYNMVVYKIPLSKFKGYLPVR